MKSKPKRKFASDEEIANGKRRKIMENQRSDLDQQSEADTHNTKKSDSGYSTGCSNSQSQRSDSSKSIHSNSGSSNSSGYGGLPATGDEFPQPHATKSSKVKEHKKKKCKTQDIIATGTDIADEDAQDKCNEGMEVQLEQDAMTLNSLNESISNNHADDPKNNENNTVSGNNNNSNNNNNNNISCGSSSSSSSSNGNNNNGVTAANNSGEKIIGSGGSGNKIIGSNNASNASSCGALHRATLAHTLNCIKRMRNPDIDFDSNFEPFGADKVMEGQESIFSNLKLDQLRSGSGEFCLIVSMHDGKVLFATPALTEVLGFPSDMWIGRSLIDFIHHKDRVAFANHITIRVAGPMCSNADSTGKGVKTPGNKFFCCLRKYRGLRTSGFGVKDKAVEYIPFQLSLSFREVKGEIMDNLLFITATALKTAYKRPDEAQEAPRFVTRHLSNCILSHIDPEAISYLGYLPQDMIGRSIFDFYHSDDLPLFKEIYEKVLAGHGSPYRSKPYRFRTQNGGYVILETEWSSFINPWSRKLEFAIGQHKVLKGPPNPDVFAAPSEFQQFPDEVVKENKAIQEEIKRLLNEPVFRCTDSVKQQVSQKCKDLATFMESLMDEITKPDSSKLDDAQAEGGTFSEKDSVMLGEISPHHDYFDSKSSTETPPSYNQLNYNENLQRFFESKPKTSRTSDENSDLKIHSSLDEEDKIISEMRGNRKCSSPVNGSGTCSGSGSGLSSASNCITGTTSTEGETNKYPEPYEQPTVLTEAVLSRHNEDMEKVLVRRHRDLRVKDGRVNENRLRNAIEKLQDHCHGLKRSGSQSWEEDKISKHRHTETNERSSKNCSGGCTKNKTETTTVNFKEPGAPQIYQQGPTNINLWPPFSVTAFNQSVTSHATYTTGNGGMPMAGVIPIYYIPTGAGATMSSPNPTYPQKSMNTETATPDEKPGPPNPLVLGSNAFMPQVYPAVGFGTPLMYSPMMMAPQTSLQTQSNKLPNATQNGTSELQRPASQATSVKAEPGSVMGSMVLSECSKKEEKSMDSPEAEDSPNLSQDEDKTEKVQGMAREGGNGTGDESSHSSFSSFLKTDDSMKSSEEADCVFNQSMNWEQTKEQDTLPRPVRKEPPWLEHIKLTPDLAYRYQLSERVLENVLESDLQALRNVDQPKLVDDQLQQLYVDLELEGLSTKLKLDEGITSSCSSSSEDCGPHLKQKRKKRRQQDYTKLVMIYEENMPLPSPAISAVATN